MIRWFKAYTAFLCMLYLACMAFSFFLLVANPAKPEMSALEARILGAVLLLVGGALFAACLVPLLVRPRPWVWTYDLVVICLGMTSACFLPACIPLLIYWLKPETKAWFGRR